jgi:hypothetical protein
LDATEAASCGDISGTSVGAEATSGKETACRLVGVTGALRGVVSPLYAYTTPVKVASTTVVTAMEMSVTLLIIGSSKSIGQIGAFISMIIKSLDLKKSYAPNISKRKFRSDK